MMCLSSTSQWSAARPAVIPLASTNLLSQKLKEIFSPPHFFRTVMHNCFFFKHLEESTMHLPLKWFWLGWPPNVVLLVTFIIIWKATKGFQIPRIQTCKWVTSLSSYSQKCMVASKKIQLPKLATKVPRSTLLSIKFSQIALKHFA